MQEQERGAIYMHKLASEVVNEPITLKPVVIEEQLEEKMSVLTNEERSGGIEQVNNRVEDEPQ